MTSTERSRRSRLNNPLRYVWTTLKNNAKRRGKEFSLTLEEFKEFCLTTDYMRRRGRSMLALTLDRVIDSLGYTKDNIQVLTMSDNSKKRWSRQRVFMQNLEDEFYERTEAKE